jgi:hypothetical protein
MKSTEEKNYDKKIHEEALKNDAIREKPEYIEIFNIFSKEYVEILKKPDDEAESKELFLNFEDKVYNAFRKLGMTDHSENLRFDFSDITSKGHQKYKIEKKNDFNNYVSVIPVTEEQKEIYSKHLDGKMFSYLEKVDFPEFSKEQLNSVPDVVLNNNLTEYQKGLLLLGDLYLDNDTNLSVDKNNNIIQYYMDETLTSKLVLLLKNDVSFDNNLILKTINIMSTNVDFDKAKDLDVVGFERPLKVNDPVAIVQDGKNLQGKVVGFDENGDVNLLISNSRDIKELTVKADAKLEPMFILNKDEKMVYLKFTYEEAKTALNNKSDINLKQNKEVKSPIFNLMLGNKTDVIPFEKNIDNKLAPIEGRLELRRKANSGEAYVHGEVKHRELNLSLPIYGLQLNDKQKEDLVSKKDIGLVQGFKANDGKEFALWVSLDDKLNKVVTAPERSININMIFGVKTTEEQRNQIKSGEGAVIDIKGKEYLFQASAATTKADGLKSNLIEKKIEKTESQSKEVEKEEKKSKGKGLKI